MRGSDQRDGESITSTLLDIFRSSGPYTGYEFLKATTVRLADILGVKIVYISELLPSRQRARIIATSNLAESMEGQEYALDDGLLASEPESEYPAQSRRPLAGVDPSQTYIAAPLKSKSQDLIGLLVVVNDLSGNRSDFAASLLAELTPHVGAHLEKIHRDRDIVRNEAALRRQYQYSKDILFYYLAGQSRFEFISPVVGTITGYPQEAFLADPRLAEKIVRAEDLVRLRAQTTSGSEEPILARITRADGSEAWLEVTCHVFRDSEGSIVACCGEARDFSSTANTLEALRQRDQYKSALLQSSPETLFRLDLLGKILDYIPGDPITTIDSQAPLIGRNVRQVLPPGLVTPVVQLVSLVSESGQMRRAEFEIASEARIQVFETRMSPIDEKEVVLRLRDITSVRWHEDEQARHRFRDEIDAKVEMARANPYQLTYRELAILHLVAEGQADKQIAEALGISTYTVNKHVGNILGKMYASSRTEAGVRALREGLVG
jgi:DNA-binding CsgD family transcriptional regulator/PAS domain-containing protein